MWKCVQSGSNPVGLERGKLVETEMRLEMPKGPELVGQSAGQRHIRPRQ